MMKHLLLIHEILCWIIFTIWHEVKIIFSETWCQCFGVSVRTLYDDDEDQLSSSYLCWSQVEMITACVVPWSPPGLHCLYRPDLTVSLVTLLRCLQCPGSPGPALLVFPQPCCQTLTVVLQISVQKISARIVTSESRERLFSTRNIIRQWELTQWSYEWSLIRYESRAVFHQDKIVTRDSSSDTRDNR